MSNKVFLIFPNQLFQDLPEEIHDCSVFIIEDSLFFGDKHHPTKFHKQKILFHRLTMNAYKEFLSEKGIDAKIITYNKEITITEIATEHKWKEIITYDPVDFILHKRLKKLDASVQFIPTKLFLNSTNQNKDYFGTKESPKKSLKMQNFYVHQRKRLNILMDENGKPAGGKWSYDESNRKKIPQKKHSDIPEISLQFSHKDFSAIKDSVEKEFPNNPGSLKEFIYPTTASDANAWFNDFLENRFALFGDYEDAIVENHNFLYHSLLSPLINIGLLTPQHVVKQSLNYAKQNNIPINALEGFIRQIIGWREYIRATYEIHSVQMRNTNHWQHTKNLPESFYTASTELIPVDTAISRTLNHAYNHHIERLMILGNIMFLLEIDPDHIYKWFMEMYIDSYDWVMVPNVYSMSQNADGGLTTTKPYFSGSNYISKMSDFKINKKQDDWSDIWDGLYWGFIKKHKEQLSKNHRWSMMVSLYEKDPSKYEQRISTANDFKQKLLH